MQWLPSWGDPRRRRQPKKNKYGAEPTVVDGHRFPSKKEANHYVLLKHRLAAGEIADLELQPRYVLHGARGGKVGTFKPDFRYRVVATGEVAVVDVKGGPTRTEAYQLRKRLLRDEYGIELKEV